MDAQPAVEEQEVPRIGQDALQGCIAALPRMDAWPGGDFLCGATLRGQHPGETSGRLPVIDSVSETRVIPANEYRRVRWKNQLGWTREIVRVPDRDDWDWRLSIAEIEQDAPFSLFPGIERELVLLSGNGLRLAFDDGETCTLEPPHGRLRFDGGRAVSGELLDGRTHDFNLMWRRDAVVAELWHRPLVGPMVIFVEPRATWVAHLISGHARFADESGLPPLAAGDTAILVAGGQRLRYVLEGGGEALLVRIAGTAADAQ
jgi:hypothetical protein